MSFIFKITITTPNQIFTIPCPNISNTFNATVDYGDSTGTFSITSYNDSNLTHTFAVAGQYTITISGTFPSIRFAGHPSSLLVNEVVDLGDVGWTTFSGSFTDCVNLTSFNSGTANTSDVTDMGNMFTNCTSLTNLDLSSFDTSNVIDMSRMFYSCTSLTSLDLSNFNTSNVTNMVTTFYRLESLTSLDLSSFDTSNVTNMTVMFSGCTSLTSLDLSSFDTSNVTNMSSMFASLTSLTSLDLSSFDTANVTNMSSMFRSSNSLTSLDLSNFNTSNVTNMSAMFNSCGSLTSLDLSSFDTSNVTNMSSMFFICNSLTSLDLSSFDTSSTTTMSSMFFLCTSLTSLNVSSFNTANVTNMSGMFYVCNKLTNLDVSSFDTANVTDMSNMFRSCNNLIGLQIAHFDISNVTNGADFLSGSNQALTTESYKLLLESWARQDAKPGVAWHFDSAKHMVEDIAGWYNARNDSLLSIVNSELISIAINTDEFGPAQQIDGLSVGSLYRIELSAYSNNTTASIRIIVSDSSNLTGSSLASGIGSVDCDTTFVAIASTMYAGVITTGHSLGDYCALVPTVVVKLDNSNITYDIKSVIGLDGTGYYLLNTPFTATGSFSISATPVIDDYSKDSVIFDTLRIIANTGLVEITVGGVSVTSNFSLKQDHIARNIKVTLEDSAFTFYEDGNAFDRVLDADAARGTFSITTIGSTFDSIIYDVGLIGITNQSYLLNQTSNDIETSLEGNHTITYVDISNSTRSTLISSAGDWVGPEQYSPGSETLEDKWTDNQDGTFTITSLDGSFSGITMGSITAPTVRLGVDINRTSGEDNLSIFNNPTIRFDNQQRYNYIRNGSTPVSIKFARAGGGGPFPFISTISNLSYRSAIELPKPLVLPEVSDYPREPVDIGFNLTASSYWTSARPFIDLMKSAHGIWRYSGGHSNDAFNQPNQFIDQLPAGVRAEMYVIIHNTTWVKPGRYICTWDGEATCSFRNFPAVNRLQTVDGTNRISIEVFNPDNLHSVALPQQLTIYVENFTDVPVDVTNIQIFHEDHEDALNNGEIFNPDYDVYYKDMDLCRFMDWTRTNNSDCVNYTDYNTLDSLSWADGVPYSVCAKFAKKYNAKAWFCIPHQATDEYVLSMASEIYSEYPTGDFIFEYSNEVWNSSFTQHRYTRDILGPRYTSSTDATQLIHNGLACRSIDIFDIIDTVIPDTQYKRFLSGQPGSTSWFNMLDLIYNDKLISNSIDYWGTTEYITVTGGFGIDNIISIQSMLENKSYDRLDYWWEQVLAERLQSDRLEHRTANDIIRSKNPDLRMIVYEAGQHFVVSRGYYYDVSVNTENNTIVKTEGSWTGLMESGDKFQYKYSTNIEMFDGSNHYTDYYVRLVNETEMYVYKNFQNYIDDVRETILDNGIMFSLSNETRLSHLQNKVHQLNIDSGVLYEAVKESFNVVTTYGYAIGYTAFCDFASWTNYNNGTISATGLGMYFGFGQYPTQFNPIMRWYLDTAAGTPQSYPTEPPVVFPGQQQYVNSGGTVYLNGEADDFGNLPMTYMWTAPDAITLSDNTKLNPFFIAPIVTEPTPFVITLIANNGMFNSIPRDLSLVVLPAENWYLKFDGVDDYVQLGEYTFPSAGIWYAEFQIDDDDLSGSYAGLYIQANQVRLIIRRDPDTGLVIWEYRAFSGNFERITGSSASTDNFITVRTEIDFDLNLVRTLVNNQELHSDPFSTELFAGQTVTGDNFTFGKEFARNFGGDLYYIDINNQLLYRNDESNEITDFPEILKSSILPDDHWYLAVDGVDDYITLANVTMPTSGIFSYSFDLQAYPSANPGAGSYMQFGNFSRLLTSVYTDTNKILFDLLVFGGARVLVRVDVDFSEKVSIKFEIDFDVNELRVYIDDVLLNTTATFDFLAAYGGRTTTQHTFGKEFIRFLKCDLYEINVNNEWLYRNDEGGQLTYLPEIIQDAHGTLNDFTLPDAWVYYPEFIYIDYAAKLYNFTLPDAWNGYVRQ